MGPSKVGSSTGQEERGPPRICCIQGKQEGGVPALPYSAAFVPCLLLAWGSTGVAVPGQFPIVLGATAQPCSQWGGDNWPGPHGFLVLLGRR